MHHRIRWKFVLIPTLIVLFLSVYPQINVWMAKGRGWNGAYVVSNYDEVAYSSYVNALINDRPRKTDPFIGKDNIEGETLYSIQAVPAFTTAYVAKVFGLSASSAFIILNFLIAIFSTVAIFFLIRAVTGDDLVAGVGALAVLCLGTGAAFQGELQHMILGNYLCDFFPFLRRYQPGFAFPIFFVFCFLIWRAFTSEKKRSGLLYAAASGAVFVILVYSYFYLWTAALAWFGVFAGLSFLARGSDRRNIAIRGVIVGAFAVAAVVPFFILLSHRVMNMDDVQLLDLTHAPNVFELPELLGLTITAACLCLAKTGKLELRSPTVLFILSLALTPIVLFNQQVLTGHSLQPVHYAIFIANYLVVLSAVLLVWNGLRSVETGELSHKARRGFVYLALVAVIWGFVESSATTKRNAGYEGLRDDAMPVLTYLRDAEPAKPDADGQYPTVLSTNLMVADYLPTVTSYRSLWNPHTNSAGGVTSAENLELFERYAYLSGYDENDLAQAMDDNLYEVMAALFGGGRAVPELATAANRITAREKQAAIARYKNYIAAFDQTHASPPVIEYLIVPVNAEPDYKSIDRWYVRDEGKAFGLFKLFHLERRAAN